LEGSDRDELARAALQPLGEDERPVALILSIAVAVILAAVILLSLATVHNIRSHGGSLVCVLLALAVGMYQRRYWAVLAFEALLAFQILVTSLALVVASTIIAALVCLLSILLSGWLFWKLVRVMGRIQVSEQLR
jgi:hypothetical protein